MRSTANWDAGRTGTGRLKTRKWRFGWVARLGDRFRRVRLPVERFEARFERRRRLLCGSVVV